MKNFKPVIIEFILFATMIVGIPHSSVAQSGDNDQEVIVSSDKGQNYIITKTPRIEIDSLNNNSSSKVAQEINYFDGLGRPSQNIQIGDSPKRNDIVQHIAYDEYGRQSKKYLPYTAEGASGAYRDSAEQELFDFYKGQFTTSDKVATTQNPFKKILFEDSPLNRIMAEGAPGSSWQPQKDGSDNAIHHKYQTNQSNEVLLFRVNSNNSLIEKGHYTKGTLYKHGTRDENGNWSYEYKDMQGQVVLKKSYNGTDSLETYYVYDDYGQLRYVLPPKATALYKGDEPLGNVLAKLCYYYQYDGRKRIIKKKLPGQDTVLMVYDKRDRVVLTQDGNLDKRNAWNFTKYDQLNRPVLTGIWHDPNQFSTQEAMQEHVNQNMNQFYETQDYTSNSWQGYTNESFPPLQNNDSIYTVTYYDDYNFDDDDIEGDSSINEYLKNKYSSFDEPGKVMSQVKGQVTGTKTRVLGTDQFLLTVNLYDNKYRTLATYTEYYPAGDEVILNKYDFVGDVLVTKTIHHKNSTAQPVEIKQRFKYDHAGRLKKTWHQVNDRDSVLLASLEYNELGELVKKKLHSTDQGAGFLQEVDFGYNIRGWMTRINDPEALGGDLYGMKLAYNNDIGLTADAQYNGNISAMTWNDAYSQQRKGYSFKYDSLNRLKEGDYSIYNNASWSDITDYDLGKVVYDANGNITELIRNGSDDKEIDNLTYEYGLSNRLQSVEDNAPGLAGGFENNGVSKTKEYHYDANGNMTKDENKNLDVWYNSLNLPGNVITNSHEISYLYLANGTKLARMVAGNTTDTTYYMGSFEYKNGELNQVFTSEGRVRYDETSGEYHYDYYLKDHLGNTRVLFTDSAGTAQVLQVSNYYPFGMQFNQAPSYQQQPNDYLYNGKEKQAFGLDWYDYGARMYDAAIGRWHVPDPMQQFHSPYNYSGNNPINNIDPSGMYSYNWNTGEYEDSDGNVVSWNEVKDNNYQEPDDDEDENKDNSKKENVAIDPGHGDHHNKNSQVDPGAVNGEDKEKDFVLNISKAVKKELKAKGYIVTMTRTGDVENAGTKLQWRIDKASGTDIFVSIHINSFGKATANGFQVCYKTGDTNSKSLAQSIQNQNTLFTSRGIKPRSNLYVLNKYSGTAVLVEAGFISNTNDLKILKNNTSKIGKQIATGIINFTTK